MESREAITKLTALAHEGRLEIFRLLVRRAPGAVPAGEIALALGVRGSTLSNQLSELAGAGLIQSERRGRSIAYSADLEAAGRLLGFLGEDCCRGRPEACLPVASPQVARLEAQGGADMVGEGANGGEAQRAYKVLFLCVGNSARSIFAEGILSRVGGDRFIGYSAGSSPRGEVHPRAKALLESMNYKTEGFRSKSWNEFAQPGAPELDFVFTVCDNAANETCPVWPGQPMSAHWGVPDPADATGNDAEVAVAFTEAYRVLFNRINAFTSLPIHQLDRLSLQKQLDAIGSQSGPDGQHGAGLTGAA